MQKVFFHFGPGGHARTEQAWLASSSKLHFFDCSTLSPPPCNFDEMVNMHREYIEENFSEPVEIVAHSFGCNVAWKLQEQLPEKITKVKLISPMRDIKQSLINFCQQVSLLEKNKTLTPLVASLKKDPSDLTALWSAVGLTYQQESALPSLWSSVNNFNKWVSLQALSPEFDFNYWTSFLNQYFDPKQQVSYSNKSRVPIKAYLGLTDPYLTHSDFNFWKELLGVDNVITCPNSSHFPHLEEPLLLELQIK